LCKQGFRYFIFTLLLKAGKYDNKKNWQSRIRFFKDFTCSGAHLKTGQVLEIIPLSFNGLAQISLILGRQADPFHNPVVLAVAGYRWLSVWIS